MPLWPMSWNDSIGFIAPPDSSDVAVFGAVILTRLLFGRYDLVVFILPVLLKPTTTGQIAPPDPRRVPLT